MREILFRGKQKYNGEWIISSNVFFGESRKYMYFQNPDNDPVENAFVCREVIPETVGQYTGLTDKNGNLIFEDDIIDASKEWWNACGPAGHDSPIIKVEWSKEHCGFDPFSNYDSDCGVYINASGCEVIGNIHDNLESLGNI